MLIGSSGTLALVDAEVMRAFSGSAGLLHAALRALGIFLFVPGLSVISTGFPRSPDACWRIEGIVLHANTSLSTDERMHYVEH